MEEIDVILERPMQEPVIPFTLRRVSFLLLFFLASRQKSLGRFIDITIRFKDWYGLLTSETRFMQRPIYMDVKATCRDRNVKMRW